MPHAAHHTHGRSDMTARSSRSARGLLATAATAGACGLVLLAAAGPSPKETSMTTTITQLDAVPQTTPDAIRPFHFTAPQAALDDLRRRIEATQWPDKETVTDASQGV